MTRIAPEYQHESFEGERAHLTLHQVVVLGDLLRRATLLDVREECQQDILRKWLNICLRESGMSNSTRKPGDNSLSLVVDLEEQDSLNCDGGIRVDDVIVRAEMLNEQGKDRDQLFFCELQQSAECQI